MKITKIRIDSLAVPLVHPYHLSKEYGIFSTATPVVVTVSTDEGITGYGECDPWPLFTGDSAPIAALILERHLGPMLLGKDPTDLPEIHRTMDACIRNNHLTKSAIDMACFDIKGKAEKKAVHEFLGGKKRDEMRCMWSVGGASIDEGVREVLDAKKQGYDGCMIKVGRQDWKMDVVLTAAIREAVGKDFPLIADANQGWDADTAISYLRETKHLGLLFFEQPVQSYDTEGMAKVRRASDIPISADEGVVTLSDAKRLVKDEAADIFSIKVTKNGGILPAKEICEFAAEHGVQVFFNSMIEEGITEAASLMLGVTRENIVTSIGHAYFSPNRLESDICSYHEQIRPEEGKTVLSTLPGLGVRPDEIAMKRYRTETAVVSAEENHKSQNRMEIVS